MIMTDSFLVGVVRPTLLATIFITCMAAIFVLLGRSAYFSRLIIKHQTINQQSTRYLSYEISSNIMLALSILSIGVSAVAGLAESELFRTLALFLFNVMLAMYTIWKLKFTLRLSGIIRPSLGAIAIPLFLYFSYSDFMGYIGVVAGLIFCIGLGLYLFTSLYNWLSSREKNN